MFEKLLAVLPYNPSLAHQLAFYSKRMREEASIRRIGLIFIILAFFIQFFAVMSPPQATVADSSNDLINGGISSRADAVSACKNNTRHYGDILANYGITCSDVANSDAVSLKSTDHDKNLYSAGFNPQGAHNNNTGKPTGEVGANIPAAGRKIYWRYLWSWDSASYSTYKALKLKSSATGKTFYILYNCGNLVSIGVPAAIPPCPYNKDILSTDAKCVKPCQYNKSIPASSSKCFAPCPIPGKSSIPQSSPQCFAPCPYNKSIPASNAKCFQPCQYNKSIPANSPSCYPPCQYNSSISSTSPDCKPCTASSNSADSLACVQISKTASNQTQNIADANNTTARPGDVIVYTLYAKNTGKSTVKAFVMAENLNDVLDYANVVDLHGGSFDPSTGLVSWAATDIKAGATLSHQITVKVKDPIPQTPASTSDPAHFDLVMTNVYGNTININVPGSPTKTVEATTTTLPNTGPGTSLFVAAAIVILAGYFYARSRLLAKESILAIQETTGA